MYLAVSPCISPPRTSVLSGGRDGTVCTTPLRGGAAPPSTLLCKGRGIVQRLLTLAVALIPTLTLALALTLTLTLTLTRHRAAAAIALRAARPSLGRLLRVSFDHDHHQEDAHEVPLNLSASKAGLQQQGEETTMC